MAQAPQNRDLAERFIEFYRNYYQEETETFAQQCPEEEWSLHIDYDDLCRFDLELADGYITKPGQFQKYAEETLRLFDLPADAKLGQAHVRTRDLPGAVDIRNLGVNDDHIGTLISVQGIVQKATDVCSKITEVASECQCYGTTSYIPQGDGGFQEPHGCQRCECQGSPRIDSDQSNFVDSQRPCVQESPEGLRGGETPQSIDINPSDDVTGKATAGDHVTVVGVLHIEQQTSGNEKTPVLDYYMEGIPLTIEDEEFEDMEMSDEDVAEIVELLDDLAIYEKMVESVAFVTYGYEQEKIAMILQLFSGVTKRLPDGSRIHGDSHMLLIGDPGTGKSQMLSYIRYTAPRSVYTSSKSSSSVGFTTAVVRDDFGDGQQWTLEAGAFVLADKGIATADELDKMWPEDRFAMHEGFGQQQISVSKAGINVTLKSRCSLLGAVNPKYGRFDQYEPTGKQIDLEPTLISRFDLILMVMGDPDPDGDSRFADHILKTNYAGEPNTQWMNVANSESTEQQADAVTNEIAPTIDADLLCKYIAYAKRTCYPTMTDEAKEVIRDFYADFRARGADEDVPTPMTVRKLEVFVRLGEVSARVRLSNKVAREDAEHVTGIVESCLRDIDMDSETGEFDADIAETSRLKTQRDRIKNLLELIRTMQEEYEEGVPHEEVLERANSELNMDKKTVNDQLDKLKMRGDIYEPRDDVYRTT